MMLNYEDIEQGVDELIYSGYAYNRETMTADQLLKLFPESGEAMEERYQIDTFDNQQRK